MFEIDKISAVKQAKSIVKNEFMADAAVKETKIVNSAQSYSFWSQKTPWFMVVG
jgi:hypothetical protein